MDGRALSRYTAFRQSGDLRDLNAAIKIAQNIVDETPETHPCYDGLLNNLGIMLESRYERLGTTEDLSKAIDFGERVQMSISQSHPNYIIYLSALGNKYQRRFECSNDIQDLEKSICLGREAVESALDGQPYTAAVLKSLSAKLARRHEVLGNKGVPLSDTADLNEAIQLAQKAAKSGSGNAAEEAEDWHNIANMYDSRFAANGKVEDLTSAIKHATRALDLTSDEDPNRGNMLNGLSGLLYQRFELTSNMVHLKEAISKAEQAVEATPNDHPYHAGCQIHLGHILWKRFEQTARTEDLTDAIQQVKLGVEKTPQESFAFPLRSNTLGAMLQTLYERSDAIKDLEEAIEAIEKALEKTKVDRRERPMFLNNLSVLFMHKFYRSGDYKMLDRAIDHANQAGVDTPPDHPGQASHWNNLGISFETRYREKKIQEDLNRVIQYGRASVKATSSNHIDLPGRLNNLGHRLCLLSEDTAQDEALGFFKRSWDCLNGVPFYRVDAARQAVRILKQQGKWKEAKDFASKAIDLLPILNNRSLNRQDQQHVASKFSGLVAEACSLSLQVGDDVAEALTLLERGRGSILSLLIDDRSDTALLRAKYPDYAYQYEKLQTQVNATAPLVVGDFDTASPKVRNRADQVLELDACITRIRQLPHFERFLLGPTAEEIKELAREGPIAIINVSDLRGDAFIVLPSAIKSIRLHAITQVKVKDWLAATKNTTNYLTGNKTYRMFLQELWLDCVRPILQETFPVRDKTLPRLWWIGVGDAGALPFHVACDDSKGATESTSSWVISSYIPTLKALAYARDRARKREGEKDQSPKLLIVAMPQTPGHDRLAGVSGEVSAVQRGTSEKFICRQLVQPNVKTVLEQLGEFDIVHFACHGASNASDPMSSFLVLQKTKGSTATVDQVTVRQISEANPKNARIAYLSACSTAENRAHQLTDEVIHLASAFQVAGFCHVISSMWKANDAACIAVAEGFYQGLRLANATSASESNRIIATALHDSVNQLRSDQSTKNAPLLWGPFIHIGA